MTEFVKNLEEKLILNLSETWRIKNIFNPTFNYHTLFKTLVLKHPKK